MKRIIVAAIAILALASSAQAAPLISADRLSLGVSAN